MESSYRFSRSGPSIRLFGVAPPLHTYTCDAPSGWVIAATACHSNRTDTPPNGKRLVTPEEQYVQCMDAAYAAADKETCLKMMRKAEGLLRGEFGAQLKTMTLESQRWRAEAKTQRNPAQHYVLRWAILGSKQ